MLCVMGVSRPANLKHERAFLPHLLSQVFGLHHQTLDQTHAFIRTNTILPVVRHIGAIIQHEYLVASRSYLINFPLKTGHNDIALATMLFAHGGIL